MSQIPDQTYLLTQQYQDASNLNARIQLHMRFGTNKYHWQRWVFDHFNMPPQARVLELGCGPGELWHKNLDRIPENWDITLSDFSPGMLQQAQQNLRDSSHRLAFQLIDAQAIPFEDEYFDIVIANHMLYHVPDRAKALSEIHRILRPGGSFYAATNGRNHMRELEVQVSRLDPDMAALRISDPFFNSFRLENGTEQLLQWFTKVTLHRYEDALFITEAAPLVAYVLSMSIASSFTAEKVAQLTRLVEQELATHGAILITKDTGLFEARRASSATSRRFISTPCPFYAWYTSLIYQYRSGKN